MSSHTKLAMLALALLAGCDRTPPGPRPNVLWVVWDTVRADHLSLYGHTRETTPFLDEWAEDARVFTDCISSASYTLPSHASMFTGAIPSEHCAHNGHQMLDDDHVTLAELLRDAGYQTYLYSANPNVSDGTHLTQGFDSIEYPWSPQFKARAREIIFDKVAREDQSSELTAQLEMDDAGERRLTHWNIKATGELTEAALTQWLDDADADRPWFAFLNYMEAHRPYIPAREFRERFMTPEEVEASYRVDRSWEAVWEFTFGLREYTPEELELTRKTYDATLLELDAHFASLMRSLQRGGWLENTVVVLVSDHGEALGEHHMLDHQYSLYEPVLGVPLVVKYPAKIAPGRDDAPVMSYDLFPTLLELTGTDPPPGHTSRAVSLLSPRSSRLRLSEEPATTGVGIAAARAGHPGFDPGPWRRNLRAIRDEHRKYIWTSGLARELYDLRTDRGETRNLVTTDLDHVRRLDTELEGIFAGVEPCDGSSRPRQLTAEEIERLKSLGYQ